MAKVGKYTPPSKKGWVTEDDQRAVTYSHSTNGKGTLKDPLNIFRKAKGSFK